MEEKCTHKDTISQGRRELDAEYCEVCGEVLRVWTYDQKNDVRTWYPRQSTQTEDSPK